MQHAMKREIQTDKEINDCPKIGGVENYSERILKIGLLFKFWPSFSELNLARFGETL